MSVSKQFVEKLGEFGLVIEIPATRKDCRAWVLVAKMHYEVLPDLRERFPGKDYAVIWVEVPSRKVRMHWDEGVEVDVKHDSEEHIELYVTKDELEETLARWIKLPDDYARFVLPFPSSSEYPFFW